MARDMRERLFAMLGHAYQALYRLPVIGDPLVRGIAGVIAFFSYHSPYGIKTFDSMDRFRKDFERLVELAGVPITVTGHDQERLQFTVHHCPYGFARPEHRGVCDAAMDMDRKMFGYCGARLVIDARIPEGSPACMISIYGPLGRKPRHA